MQSRAKNRAKEQEFEQLVSANRALISKVCYMYASDTDHFNDLFQETLINLWQSIDRFRGDSSIATWIYRITINTCVTFFRRHDRHNASTVSLDVATGPELASLTDDDSEHTRCLREMYSLIGRLPAIDKAIVMMWLDELPYDQIASVTGLSRNNVATRLHRAKQRLAAMSDE